MAGELIAERFQPLAQMILHGRGRHMRSGAAEKNRQLKASPFFQIELVHRHAQPAAVVHAEYFGIVAAFTRTARRFPRGILLARALLPEPGASAPIYFCCPSVIRLLSAVICARIRWTM